MTTPTKAQLTESLQEQLESGVMLEERLAELELALEDVGWISLTLETAQDFSRGGLAKIIQIARLMARKNPLINHAIIVMSDYVYGQGVSTGYTDERLNDVWQAFWDDPRNQSALTDHRALIENEQELEQAGNLFYALFTNISTGRVRVRSIPVEEIQGIICNPDDAQEPWYYKRVWQQQQMDLRFNEAVTTKQQTAFYPDFRYWPTNKPGALGQHPVLWDSPVYHTKVGGSLHMKFGVPEIYPALDWAKAVKEFLEDVATTHRALARFAWNATAKGSRGVAAMRAKLGTTLSAATGQGETNPPPVVGSTAIGADGTAMTPIKTAGMAPTADEGKGIDLMVSAGTGVPRTILFGDADVGNLATAKTLDRPTELKMVSRQQLWSTIFRNLSWYVTMQAVMATANRFGRGVGRVVPDPDDNSRTVVWANDVDAHLNVDWPPILERDVAVLVEAIVKAVTLDGKAPAAMLTLETITRMLLKALGEDDIDEVLAKADEVDNATQENFGQALREVRQMVEVSKNGS